MLRCHCIFPLVNQFFLPTKYVTVQDQPSKSTCLSDQFEEIFNFHSADEDWTILPECLRRLKRQVSVSLYLVGACSPVVLHFVFIVIPRRWSRISIISQSAFKYGINMAEPVTSACTRMANSNWVNDRSRKPRMFFFSYKLLLSAYSRVRVCVCFQKPWQKHHPRVGRRENLLAVVPRFATVA